MKKFLVAALIIAMVSMMGLVAFAYPDEKVDLVTGAVKNSDGTVTVTIDQKFVTDKAGYALTVVFFDTDPQLVADDDASFWLIYHAVDAERDARIAWYKQVSPGAAEITVPADANLEDGKTYYIGVCSNPDGGGTWYYSSKLHGFTYAEGGSDEPTTTADVSTIAFAVASVLGCGALAVRKKR